MSPTITDNLSILRCPLTGQSLELLSSAGLEQINHNLRLNLWGHAGCDRPIAPLVHGLCTPAGDVVYRIDDDIICLLPDMAIRSRTGQTAAPGLRPECKTVQAFYDEFGWMKNPAGHFNDTVAFTETRPCARRYQKHCNDRIIALLGRGNFLLDVASGAIPHSEYLEHSRHYRTRICVDFSIRALQEARGRIGSHGLFILGDITHLPLAPDAIDAVISLHTIYHLPPEEQIKACDELMRVACPHAPVLVVYVWSTSPLMRLIDGLRRSYRRLNGHAAVSSAVPEAAPPVLPALYFHPQDHAWFAAHIGSRNQVALRVWSAVTREFQTRFFTDNFGGRLITIFVMLFEDAFPNSCGRLGHYPIWKFSKTIPWQETSRSGCSPFPSRSA